MEKNAVGRGREWDSVVQPVGLGRGCVLRVDMESAGSARVLDGVGVSHGTVTGAVRTVERSGLSRFFDGTDDLIDCGKASVLGLLNTLTIEAWVRPNIAYASSDATVRYRAIVCKASGGAASGVSYLMDWYGDQTGRTLRLTVSDGVALKSHTSTGCDMAQSWTHVVGTVEYPGQMKLYKNGALLSAIASTKGCQLVDTEVHIGRNFRLGNTTYTWSGWIGDVGLYSVALSAGEIRDRFRRGARKYGVAW